MKIVDIRLKNFKRFSDLVIREIPQTAKLVLVVGPNGCGKSSLFDAFLHRYRMSAGFGLLGDMLYYRKSSLENFDWNSSVEIEFVPTGNLKKGDVYVRSAYRNDPDFGASNIERQDNPANNMRLNRLIDNDQTVSENYKRLVHDTTAAVYDQRNDAKMVVALRDELIGAVRKSMLAVFGDLILDNIADPLGEGAFFFKKGTNERYHYKNLSGGEKAAFDLLLDVHIKKKYFPDAVFCIDEIETHLHTKVQGALLRELFAIIPDAGQLWVTTHSLGVLRAAQEVSIAKPGTVTVIDFYGITPDVPNEIVPSAIGRVAWDKLLSIALDDLSKRVSPRVIVVCEGSSVGNRRKNFDAEIYNRILASQMTDVLFVSGGSSSQVAQNGVSIAETLKDIAPTARVISLCDRDDKSNAEVASFEAEGNLVLGERNLESYLFADDVIEALASREGKLDLLPAALQAKATALGNSVTNRGNPPDDLKSAAGEMFVELKRIFTLQRCGDNKDMFMRETLAPLVAPGMATYEALKITVLDRLPQN